MITLPTTPGGWSCLCFDPPWSHQQWSEKGYGKAPRRHYPTMSLEAIKALPVGDVAARSSFLFLWTTWPHLEQSLEVMRAWGFRFSSDFVLWVKLNPRMADKMWFGESDFHIGTGYVSRKNTEPLLLGRRGKPTQLTRNVRELLIAARRQHSRKPDEAYRRIEQFCPGPRLDGFGRETRPGWTSWGLETGKFDPVAAGAIGHDTPAALSPQVETRTPRRRKTGNTAPLDLKAPEQNSLGLDGLVTREDR